MSLAELRQILKQGQDGKNLYDHLVETIMKVLLDRPQNAYDMFELISSEVKANPLNPETEVYKTIPSTPEEIATQLAWAISCSKLLKRPDEPPEVNVKFPDLMDDLNLYQWAGISFGRSEAYRLYLSIKLLAESLPSEVERLRFFGIIKTRSLPYYIVEGLNPEDEEGIDEMKQEGRNGANKYSYWVTQTPESSISQWIKLPNVTMSQVVLARQFKKYLTGSLDSPITSYPPFPGTERNYLRTIISLIIGSTSISPAGYFELNEDDDPPTVKLAEAETINEAFPKAASELKESDAWIHHEIELNSIGRCTVLPEQTDEAGEVIEPDESIEITPPLKGLDSELWTFRLSPGGAGEHAGSLVIARSLQFPGGYAIAAGKRFVNIYIGNGMIASGKGTSVPPTTYSPPLPAPLQKEWTPPEGEEPLVEMDDVRIDPTPPKAEGEEEDE